MTRQKNRFARYAGKTLLMIGAGVEQIPGILRAKALGLFVVAIDGNPQAPGFPLADAFGVVSTYDIAGAIRFAHDFARRRPIDGVMTLASDIPLTVSSVAKALGLPGNSIAAARRASDKLLMKRRFKHDGVAIPAFRQIRKVGDLANFIRRHGYPVVLKPVDSRGARGVLRILPGMRLASAIAEARKESPTGRVMAEKFIAGPQISSESILYDGKIFTTGLSDRNYEFLERFAPHIVENGGDLPASLTPAQRKSLDRLLLKAARSIGIERGSLKGDIVFGDEGPVIIEVAARLSGGYFATDEVPLATGVDIVTAVIAIALGVKPDFRALKPKFQRCVSQRFVFPAAPGIVRSIKGVEAAKRIPEIKRFNLYVKTGDRVSDTISHPSRLGCVISCARTRKRAIAAAEEAIAALRIAASPSGSP